MTEGVDVILIRAASGDQAAWREIVDTYSPRVFGLLKAQCADVELAEETTQSVFCTVAAKIGQQPGGSGGYTEQGRFEAWLFRVAINRLRDEMRRRRRQAIPVEDEHLDRMTADQETSPDREGILAMREAMKQLTPADREVLELRHLAQLSFQQISEILDQPVGTVLARQHRALKKLRVMLEAHADS